MARKKHHLIIVACFISNLILANPAKAEPVQSQADFYQQLVEIARIGTLASLVYILLNKIK